MSIVFDFKSIAENLRDDRWYTPEKTETITVAASIISRYEFWKQERNKLREEQTCGKIFKCDWCFDIGFPINEGSPCAICGKAFQ